MSQSELRREIRSTITLHPPNAFVGKIDRNSKTGILNKKPLYFIQCPCMPGSRPHILIIRRRKPPLLKTIQVFINGSYPICPQHILPFGSRKCILQHPFITVERHHLASLLFDIHLSEKVFNTVFNFCIRIFINIHHTILIKVNPSFMVHRFLDRLIDFRYFNCCLCREHRRTSQQNKIVHKVIHFCTRMITNIALSHIGKRLIHTEYY